MPLNQFIQEVMQIIGENKTEKGEVLVEDVKPLRWAEKNGQYEQMLANFGTL